VITVELTRTSHAAKGHSTCYFITELSSASVPANSDTLSWQTASGCLGYLACVENHYVLHNIIWKLPEPSLVPLDQERRMTVLEKTSSNLPVNRGGRGGPTSKCLGRNKNLGHRSRQDLKTRLTVLARAGRNLPVNEVK
jgi:hypothetical protein